METIGSDELQIAMANVVEVRVLLGKLSEQELEVLTGFKSIITVLVSSCDFLIANMNVVCKRLEQQ